MAGKSSTRSTSGARFVGDDVQHMIVWYHALSSQVEDSEISQIQVEAVGAGNIDDLAVIRDGKLPDEYWQVKASVDATSPLDEDYLLTERYKNGDSILSKMYKSWLGLERRSDAEIPKAVLATTKAILSTDPVLSQLSTDDGRLVYAMKNNNAALTSWASKINILEEDLLNFLESFEVRPALLPSHLKSLITGVSQALGLEYSDTAIAAGVQTVRNWVKSGSRTLSPQQIRDAIETLNIGKVNKSGVLVVQMGDTNPRSKQTPYSLDFVDLFDGKDAGTRRKLTDPSKADLIIEGLVSIRQKLKEDGIYNIEVDGPMRCPMWFLTGKVLSGTSAVVVSARASTGMWSSAYTQTQQLELIETVSPDQPAKAKEVVISVNLSLDISEDVDDYNASSLGSLPHVKLFVDSPGTRAIKSPSHAQAIAIAIRLAARRHCREFGAEKVHLFLGMPGQAALLIGHAWDRLPDTLVYWDMGKPGSYSPAFNV